MSLKAGTVSEVMIALHNWMAIQVLVALWDWRWYKDMVEVATAMAQDGCLWSILLSQREGG